MKIIDFFRDILRPGQTYWMDQRLTDYRMQKLDIEAFFTQMAVNLIAGTVAKCKIKTYLNGAENKDDEFYLWNYAPNDNQSGSQFKQELISKLLLNNQALVVEVSGKLLIADSWDTTPYVLFPDTFSSVSCRNMSFEKTFSAADVLYYRLGNNNIRMLLGQIMDGYAGLLDMAVRKYRRAGGRKGVVRINRSKSGDKELEDKINALYNNEFKRYFDAENAVLPLPNGVDYDEKTGDGSKKSTSEISDIQGIIKEAVASVSRAFRIPPSLLQGDIADIGALTDNFLTFCIDPLVDLIETENNRKRYGKAVLKGSYQKIDTTCIRHIDIFGVAEQADKLLADGIYSIDGLLEKIGDVPLNTRWSKSHWMTSNYQNIEKAGGEQQDETNQDDMGSQNAGGGA